MSQQYQKQKEKWKQQGREEERERILKKFKIDFKRGKAFCIIDLINDLKHYGGK